MQNLSQPNPGLRPAWLPRLPCNDTKSERYEFEPLLQFVRGTADALHAIVCGERRERVAAWKARVEASLDLPDPNDFDAMFPEITGELG